ncbi:MAG: hypothetical protein AB7F86_07235 [Bdellovibrionales bacterium]
MANKKSKTAAKKPSRKPRTKLLFNELLGEQSIIQLANKMGVVYTSLYYYKEDGANPTLLGLEDLAKGLSKLTNKPVSILDLIKLPDEKAKGPK